jgi:hypothetical protein
MQWRLLLFTWTHLRLLSEYFFHFPGSNSIYLLWRKGGSNAPTLSYSFHFLRRDYFFLKSARGLWKYDACPHIPSPSDKLGSDLLTSRVNGIFCFRDGKDLRCLLVCSARKISAWIPKQFLQYKAKESWAKKTLKSCNWYVKKEKASFPAPVNNYESLHAVCRRATWTAANYSFPPSTQLY